MEEAAHFKLRWTKREGWGEGYFDGWISDWRVARIGPNQSHGGHVSGGHCWSLPIVCHWQEGLPGPYQGVSETPREAAKEAEAALPNVLATHHQFFMRDDQEAEFRKAFAEAGWPYRAVSHPDAATG